MPQANTKLRCTNQRGSYCVVVKNQGLWRQMTSTYNPGLASSNVCNRGEEKFKLPQFPHLNGMMTVGTRVCVCVQDSVGNVVSAECVS